MNSVKRLLERVRDQTGALERARELYRHRLAPDFTPFDFIDKGENRLSRLIAWLLDPRETHEQGTEFLCAFLDELELKWSRAKLSEAHVQCEEMTDTSRRIDIVVKAGDWTLGIENKLREAGDQRDQVSHYLDYLDRTVTANRPRCLVYLTIRGELPSEYSISPKQAEERGANDQLLLMGVESMTAWLQRCRLVCRATRVTAFIEDFEHFLKRDFKGNKDMTEREQLLELACESKETIEAVMKLVLAGTEIKERLFKKLVSEIEKLILPDWQVKSSKGTGRRYEEITIAYPSLAGCRFAISCEGSNYSWLIYGVQKNEEGSLDRPDITNCLNKALGQGTRSQGWPWYQRVSPNNHYLSAEGDWGNSEAPWGKIVDGTMAGEIMKAARAVHDALAKDGLLNKLVSV